MNSEELELSLRTEFESHLKDVLADMRQEFSRFQENVNAEFDKHKSQLDAVFQEFSANLGTGKELDQGFKEMVVEHLRLARDEGARLTATALAEAEEMQRQSAPTEMLPPLPAAQDAPSAGVSELRNAINDITAQDSQGTILKSLVEHAAQFTPRGAFFIIKNEHFVGWRVFSKDGEANEAAVREVYLPVSSSSVLGESVRSLSAVESSFGTYSDDAGYLNQIGFGEPEKMIAIPLVARGRGVAVLYADQGDQGERVNIEALETLVRVAGLTVEVLASSSAAAAKPVQTETQVAAPPKETPQEESPAAEVTAEVETDAPIAAPTESLPESVSQAAETAVSEEALQGESPSENNTDVQEISVEPELRAEEPAESGKQEEEAAVTTEFQSAENQESAPELKAEEFNTQSFKSDDFAGAFETSNGNATYSPEPTVTAEPVAAPVRSRFSDRSVDLPIEVSEDERRLHNDARRFARLLVSEIKLYNEQKVKEGREAQDLYDRLREAIDRSRDMYDKRVQPPVAAKFDYFHYELVSTLAEGEPTKLGSDYPGATA